MTVKDVVQLALFPAASVAVTVIVCVPRPTDVPASGFCLTVTGPGQASLAVAATAGMGAWQLASARAPGAGEERSVAWRSRGTLKH